MTIRQPPIDPIQHMNLFVLLKMVPDTVEELERCR